MDRNTKLLLWLFIVALAISVVFSFWKYVVVSEYPIIVPQEPGDFQKNT